MVIRKRTADDELYDQLTLTPDNRREGLLIVHEAHDDVFMLTWVDEDGMGAYVGAGATHSTETSLDTEVAAVIRTGRVTRDQLSSIQAEAVELAAAEWKRELWRGPFPWGGWVWQNRATAWAELKELKVAANGKIAASFKRVRDQITASEEKQKEKEKEKKG